MKKFARFLLMVLASCIGLFYSCFRPLYYILQSIGSDYLAMGVSLFLTILLDAFLVWME